MIFLKIQPNKKRKTKPLLQKLCIKTYHTIYLLYKSTYVEFKKKDFLFYDFFIYYDFFLKIQPK